MGWTPVPLLSLRNNMPCIMRDIKRFMSYVKKRPDGCWEWTGAKSRGKGNSKWYGSFHFRGRTIRAHRFGNDILGNKICPPGHHRDHECNFSLCVRPSHIKVVTHEENQKLKMERQNGLR